MKIRNPVSPLSFCLLIEQIIFSKTEIGSARSIKNEAIQSYFLKAADMIYQSILPNHWDGLKGKITRSTSFLNLLIFQRTLRCLCIKWTWAEYQLLETVKRRGLPVWISRCCKRRYVSIGKCSAAQRNSLLIWTLLFPITAPIFTGF